MVFVCCFLFIIRWLVLKVGWFCCVFSWSPFCLMTAIYPTFWHNSIWFWNSHKQRAHLFIIFTSHRSLILANVQPTYSLFSWPISFFSSIHFISFFFEKCDICDMRMWKIFTAHIMWIHSLATLICNENKKKKKPARERERQRAELQKRKEENRTCMKELNKIYTRILYFFWCATHVHTRGETEWKNRPKHVAYTYGAQQQQQRRRRRRQLDKNVSEEAMRTATSKRMELK